MATDEVSEYACHLFRMCCSQVVVGALDQNLLWLAEPVHHQHTDLREPRTTLVATYVQLWLVDPAGLFGAEIPGEQCRDVGLEKRVGVAFDLVYRARKVSFEIVSPVGTHETGEETVQSKAGTSGLMEPDQFLVGCDELFCARDVNRWRFDHRQSVDSGSIDHRQLQGYGSAIRNTDNMSRFDSKNIEQGPAVAGIT